MKKRILFAIIIMFSLVLVSCNKDIKKANASEVQKLVQEKIKSYKEGNEVKASIKSLIDGKESTIELSYKKEGDKMKELAVKATKEAGEISVYIKDGVSYLQRYDQKTKKDISDAEAASIASEHDFSKYIKEFEMIFNNSFFTSATVENEKGVWKIKCDLSALTPDDELSPTEAFEQQKEIKKLQELKSIELNVYYNDDKKVTKVEGVFENEKVNKIAISFLAFSNIEYPSFSDYK